MPPTYSRRADHLTTTCRHYQACNASVPEPHYSSGQLRRGSFNRESPSIHTRLPSPAACAGGEFARPPEPARDTDCSCC